MAAAVPFALVAAVQLLALAAAFGLAAAAGSVAYRRSSRVALVAGGLMLAIAHGLTGALLGDANGTAFAVLRAGGYLLVGIGAGGLALASVVPFTGILVPLGAAPGAATFAAVSAVVATALSRRARRPGVRLLTVSLALYAVTEMLAAPARTSGGASALLLLLRGAASLVALAFVGRLVESSLLAKVVGAILAAVLGLALGTALIVGSVATDALNRDSESRLTDVARGQVNILLDEKQTSLALAKVLAQCPPGQTAVCQSQLDASSSRPAIIGIVCGLARPDCVKGGAFFPSVRDQVVVASLRTNGAVQEVLRATDKRAVATLDLLFGRTPSLVSAGVAPVFEATGPAQRRPDAVAVYATRIDQDRVDEVRQATGLEATLYVSGKRIASSLTGSPVAVLDDELKRLGVDKTLRDDPTLDGISLSAEGSRPGVRYEAIRSEDGSVVGVLALSGESNVILATQRRVLSALFFGTVAIALLVGVLAVALGRRIVRPVTELTVAASRVRRGDLSVRTDLVSGDELGVLSRTFDAMTASLAASNESLVRAAADEAALRGRLETIVDSIADGLVTTDARDRVVGINGAALDLLGVADTDLLGKPVTEVLTGVTASGEPLVDHLGAARLERSGRLARADGGTVPVAVVATPLRGTKGHVVVVRDMRREHEVERMKTEFLSNVSHELRTPLTPIRGYAEILHRRPDLPAEKTEMYANSILESSVRMTRVVDLLVDVAALEAGRVVPERRPVRVSDFVDERLDVWRKREPKREFRRRVTARLPDVLVDPAWVGKAYDELVDNAVKYSDRPVTLTATLADDERHVRLTVRDAGQGIPEEQRSVLFVPFEQVDGSATRAVGGLGLGLSFVRRVADDFGLDVVVESTLGKGSAFSLEVPVVARPTSARGDRGIRSPRGRRRP